MKHCTFKTYKSIAIRSLKFFRLKSSEYYWTRKLIPNLKKKIRKSHR